MQARKKLIIAAALTGVISTTAVAIQQTTQTGAEDVPPIYTQVEDHEQRIDTLETKQGETEAKVEQNSNDIQVIQQTTGTAPATSSTSSSTQQTATAQPTTQTVSEPAPAPAPEPAPQPTPDPRTITAVVEQPSILGLHTCRYTLYDAIESNRQGPVSQPAEIPCHQVGEVLPYGG